MGKGIEQTSCCLVHCMVINNNNFKLPAASHGQGYFPDKKGNVFPFIKNRDDNGKTRQVSFLNLF